MYMRNLLHRGSLRLIKKSKNWNPPITNSKCEFNYIHIFSILKDFGIKINKVKNDPIPIACSHHTFNQVQLSVQGTN